MDTKSMEVDKQAYMHHIEQIMLYMHVKKGSILQAAQYAFFLKNCRGIAPGARGDESSSANALSIRDIYLYIDIYMLQDMKQTFVDCNIPKL